jgi:hypothetical protein
LGGVIDRPKCTSRRCGPGLLPGLDIMCTCRLKIAIVYLLFFVDFSLFALFSKEKKKQERKK